MGNFRLSDAVHLLNLAADLFSQFFGRFLGIVFDLYLNENICAHPLEVN